MDKFLYFTSFGLFHSLINQQEFISTKSKSDKGFLYRRSKFIIDSTEIGGRYQEI